MDISGSVERGRMWPRGVPWAWSVNWLLNYMGDHFKLDTFSSSVKVAPRHICQKKRLWGAMTKVFSPLFLPFLFFHKDEKGREALRLWGRAAKVTPDQAFKRIFFPFSDPNFVLRPPSSLPSPPKLESRRRCTFGDKEKEEGEREGEGRIVSVLSETRSKGFDGCLQVNLVSSNKEAGGGAMAEEENDEDCEMCQNW